MRRPRKLWRKISVGQNRPSLDNKQALPDFLCSNWAPNPLRDSDRYSKYPAHNTTLGEVLA